MSNNADEEKLEPGKSFPLDLASKIPTAKADGKSPLIIPGGAPLRSIRILPQTTQVAACGGGATSTTIIATNIVPQGAIIKQGDANRAQITGIINTAQAQPAASGNITFQRQITLQTSMPVIGQTSSSGTTYHVPRGPAVVANLAAPRSNVAGTLRAPLVVTAQGATQGSNFMRPARTPSPAHGTTTWIASTTNANGSQVKGVSGVLSSTARGTITAGKPSAIVSKPQVSQIVSTIKPNTTILQSAIIGQGQLHQFKSAVPGIQTLNTTVTLAQVVPSRAQVYCTGATAQFAAAPRITVAPTTPRGVTTTASRPIGQISTSRIAGPVTLSTNRLLAPQGAVLTPAARITAVPVPSQTAAPPRIITTQANVSLGRLTVTVTNASNTVNSPLLTTIRPTLVQSVIPASNTAPNRGQTMTTKVISQGGQGTAIHLTPMPGALKTVATSINPTARTINAPTVVSQRPAVVASSHAIPITKVYSQQEASQQTSVFQLHTTAVPGAIRRTSPGPTNNTQSGITVPVTTVAAYSFYDASNNFSVARTFAQQGTTITAITQASSTQRPAAQVHSIGSTSSMRFNPVMVVEQNRGYSQDPETLQNAQQATKVMSSPRPSILRKREHDGSPLKAAKNLMSSLANIQQTTAAPLSPPSRPDSRNNGHSSGGSTTMSATSSPGLADANEDSNQLVPMNKDEEENRPPLEMSPRKKPRKQNLAGNDMDENNDDIQFLSERDIKRDQDDSEGAASDGPRDGAPESRRISNMRKPATASLLNSYKQTWKTTNNHYMRHSDVRPKDERKPTVIDLANQHRVLEKINGWKVHHLSTQMEDLAEEEHAVHNQLAEILKFTETQDLSNPDINRITELIKGNMQRVKIIKDGMIEANTAVMKVFDHKVHVTDIISRCASKRNYKKREKT